MRRSRDERVAAIEGGGGGAGYGGGGKKLGLGLGGEKGEKGRLGGGFMASPVRCRSRSVR